MQFVIQKLTSLTGKPEKTAVTGDNLTSWRTLLAIPAYFCAINRTTLKHSFA